MKMPNGCYLCGLTKTKDSTISLVRIPKEVTRRKLWLKSLDLTEDDVRSLKDPRFLGRHFRDGNTKHPPSVNSDKRFGSPTKQGGERAQRADQRKTTTLTIINGNRNEDSLTKTVPSVPNNQELCIETTDWPLLIAQGQSFSWRSYANLPTCNGECCANPTPVFAGQGGGNELVVGSAHTYAVCMAV